MTARAASLPRLLEEVAELRQLTMRLMARQDSHVALDFIPLELFASAVGRAVRTLKNDVLSSDPLRRARWPEFHTPHHGLYLTTSASVRRWLEQRGESTHIDRATRDLLTKIHEGRRRARG